MTASGTSPDDLLAQALKLIESASGEAAIKPTPEALRRALGLPDLDRGSRSPAPGNLTLDDAVAAAARAAAAEMTSARKQRDLKQLAIRTNPTTLGQLQALAREENRSIQSLLHESIRLLLLSKRLRPLATLHGTTTETIFTTLVEHQLGTKAKRDPEAHRKKGG